MLRESQSNADAEADAIMLNKKKDDGMKCKAQSFSVEEQSAISFGGKWRFPIPNPHLYVRMNDLNKVGDAPHQQDSSIPEKNAVEIGIRVSF